MNNQTHTANKDKNNYELFVQLFNNAICFLEQKTGKQAPANVTADHAIAYLSLNVKGRDLEQLEKYYKTQYQEKLKDIKLAPDDENKLKRYLNAMLELL